MYKFKLYSLLVLLIIGRSAMFSQQSVTNRDMMGELDDYRLNNLTKSDSELTNVLLCVLGTADVVDSVIITNAEGSIEKYTYTFNNNGHMILWLNENWDNLDWVDSCQATYTYDSLGNETSFLKKRWDGTNWGNSYRITSTYNSNGHIILWLNENWDKNNWISSSRNTYTYDNKGNKTSSLVENWDGTSWRNSYHITYTYNSNGKMILFLVENWNGASWLNSYRRTYTYDSNGKTTSFLNENWDGTSWVNFYRRTYTYDSNGKTTSFLDENWDGTSWRNYERQTYTYDSNGNETLLLWEKWDATYWINYFRETRAYDSNGNITLFLWERWTGTSWVYSYNYDVSFKDTIGNNYQLYGTKIALFYKTITEVEKENDACFSYKLQQNYPNPFNPTTTICYSLPKTCFVQLMVYDLLGKEVVTLVNKEQTKGNYKIEFNASNLTSGIYFYKLQTGSFIETKKLLLLR